MLEPEPTNSFKQLVSSIIELENETDRLKGQIDCHHYNYLFNEIDGHAKGYITLEDLFVFAKKNQVIINKSELKMMNKYFGFSESNQLTQTFFVRNFFQTKNTNYTQVSSCSFENTKNAFVRLIKFVIDEFIQIQGLRKTAGLQIQIIQAWFVKNYQSQGKLTKQILKQYMYDTGLYSRLKFKFASSYIFGEKEKQITFSQIFGINHAEYYDRPRVQLNQRPIEREQVDKAKISKVAETPIKKISNSQDILTQIQNLEFAIKEKKQIIALRKMECRSEQENKTRIVGTLLKRNSIKQSILCQKDNFKEKKESVGKISRKSSIRKPQPIQEEPQENNISQKQIDSAHFQEPLRFSACSKQKENAMIKVSSCARLRIEQIEKRVMSRVASKAGQKNIDDYRFNTRSTLRMGEWKNKYSNLYE